MAFNMLETFCLETKRGGWFSYKLLEWKECFDFSCYVLDLEMLLTHNKH